MLKLNPHKKLLIVFVTFFIIHLILALHHQIFSDEGTHILIGLFYKNAALNIRNFRSLNDFMNFATDYIVKYPKITASYPPLYHLSLTTILFFTDSVLVLRIFNILILILTSFIIYNISLEFNIKNNIAVIGSILLLSFSLIFHYADKIMMDIFQVLVFSLAMWYYLKLKKMKKINWSHYIKFAIILSIAFLTKFFSAFLPLIILVDSYFSNKKFFKFCFISLLISFILISPYAFLYMKYGFYKLALKIATTSPGNKLEYFNYPYIFGLFLGPFVAISILLFGLKNIKNPLFITWFIIPLIVLVSFENIIARFSFFIMPIYVLSCEYTIEKIHKIKSDHNKKILLFVIASLVVLQLIQNCYLNLERIVHPINEVMSYIKDDGNVLILTESPVHSSSYILYGQLNNVSGNLMRPCILENKNLTEPFLDEWGVRYIIDQNNTLKDTANFRIIYEKSYDAFRLRLFDTGIMKKVDCNFVCALRNKVCKNQGFSRVKELIESLSFSED